MQRHDHEEKPAMSSLRSAPRDAVILFPPYRLDLAESRLWHGEQEVVLRPKTFAVLQYLLEHPAQLVSKEDLLSAVWPDTYVSTAMPKLCIREIRQALGDDPKAPQFIETMSRRGYRFIAPLTQDSKFQVPGSRFEPIPNPQPLIPSIVGREVELGQLHSCLTKARAGTQQLLFVTGEAGIGKTTLVDAFLERLVQDTADEADTADTAVRMAQGQCVEQYGAGEAYMPVLEALGRLCREPQGQHIIDLLGQYAPTWLVQMPALLDTATLEELQLKVVGAATERMLREMAEAVEALTAERPLVLVLEDLQWSDFSTLELLSSLAQRRERMQLLVIGTFRPMDIVHNGHPLKGIRQELHGHRRCEELALEFLTQLAVGEYLETRFDDSHLPSGLTQVIHHRTDGNPLFMVNVTDYLVELELLTQVDGRWGLTGKLKDIQVGVPENLWQLLERQLDRLSPEVQRIVEVGSVLGIEFSAAAVATMLGQNVEDVENNIESVEEQCESLVWQGQLLQAQDVAEWPDGTVSAQYRFIHGLYQEVLYDRVSASRRVRLHQKIGERLELVYGQRAGEMAAELAMHFERSRDYRRAIPHLCQAADNALQRSAHQEAVQHLTKALELLGTLPDTPERAQQ